MKNLRGTRNQEERGERFVCCHREGLCFGGVLVDLVMFVGAEKAVMEDAGEMGLDVDAAVG